jgi:hypothetical protein
MLSHLHIEYVNPSAPADVWVVNYRLRDNPIVPRWTAKVQAAQTHYTIDDPGRFYGFGTHESQVADALARINQCITVIKLDYPGISQGYVTDVQDQDSLNYWHHVFEIYHGLLDNQPEGRALLPVLADLNIAVHRCESVARGAHPRHVVTWFGLPKTDCLQDDDYRYFENEWQVGTVFVNYAEIGKTLEDLAVDRDEYIGRDAFQPWCHYSADFVVRFYAHTGEAAQERRTLVDAYYERNRDLFGPRQASFVLGAPPVADVIGIMDLAQIETRQWVQSVNFS